MPNPQKIERVAELKRQIEGSTALLLTDYRGLTVSEITELRKSLRDGGARFSVIKNTLMRRALEQTDAAELGSLFEGPSAVAFVQEDPVAAAKSVTTAAKRFPALVLKGGFVEAKALAELESREVMLSKLAGLMKGEMARAAATFQAAQSRFLGLLEALKAKLPEEPVAEAAPQEPAPEAGPEEPAAEAQPEQPAAEAIPEAPEAGTEPAAVEAATEEEE
jgi:large subunit ribosomal protein L10